MVAPAVFPVKDPTLAGALGPPPQEPKNKTEMIKLMRTNTRRMRFLSLCGFLGEGQGPWHDGGTKLLAALMLLAVSAERVGVGLIISG
jgi:hypothetical protein